MFERDDLNIWAMGKEVDEFQPLGNLKLAKLIDFYSTMQVCEFLREERISYDEDVWDIANNIKNTFIEELEFFKDHRKIACQMYTFYKKLIDRQDEFPLDPDVIDQAHPCPTERFYTLPIKEKKKKKALQKVSLFTKEMTNVINFSMHAKKRSAK